MPAEVTLMENEQTPVADEKALKPIVLHASQNPRKEGLWLDEHGRHYRIATRITAVYWHPPDGSEALFPAPLASAPIP